MRNLWRLALVGTLLLGCVGCDQITKEIARAELALGESHSYFGDTFRIVHVENIGAFLGVGANLPAPARVALFQGAISLLILGLLWVAIFRPGMGPNQVAGFTLLAASGIGNLIDRLQFDGRVTDFLNFGIGNLRTGIFNIADVVGVVGLILIVMASAPSNSSVRSR
jgi:signal peptidase II